MNLISMVWLTLFAIFTIIPSICYLYFRHASSKQWTLSNRSPFFPFVTILVPTYNESNVIELKLQNLNNLQYPKELTQIIVIDSASTDNTIQEVQKYAELHCPMNIGIVKENNRTGKSHALNLGLKHSTGDIVIVSDADCFWPPDILDKALPYLADQAIGAIAGQEKLLNPYQSWVTRTESLYRDGMFKIQLGESKLFSTIQFEGGFSAYKREALDEFDIETGADDSGTALNVVQKGFRTIVVPEATFMTYFPSSWKDKISLKIRRAHHLLSVQIKAIELLIRGKLRLPKRIAVLETFLLIINPLLFAALIPITFVFLIQNPLLVPLFVVPFIIPKSRIFAIEVIQNNFILLLASTSVILKKKFIVWNMAKESRAVVDARVLRREGLI